MVENNAPTINFFIVTPCASAAEFPLSTPISHSAGRRPKTKVMARCGRKLTVCFWVGKALFLPIVHNDGEWPDPTHRAQK
jgi:hypothetical protein